MECLSKKGIAQKLGVSTKSLRRKLFTDSFITNYLGITIEDFKKIKVFDTEQSRLIRQKIE